MLNRNCVLAFLAILIAAAMALAADPPAIALKTYTLPNHGGIQMNVPKAWDDQSIAPPAGVNVPEVIELETHEPAGSFTIKIIPAILPAAQREMLTPARLKTLAESMGQKYVGTSVEKKITLTDVKGPSVVGSTWTLTDSSPNPGEFKCITGAALALQDVLLAVTIMHQQNSPAQKTAMEMVKAATIGSAIAPPTTLPSVIRMSSPDGNWDLVFSNAGFIQPVPQTSPDGKSRKFTSASDSHWLMTVFFEPAESAGNALAVRNVYWGRMKSSPMPIKNPRLSGDASAARVEYAVDAGDRNFNLYLAHENVWIDMHLSKDDFVEARDRKGIEQLLKSVKFEKH